MIAAMLVGVLVAVPIASPVVAQSAADENLVPVTPARLLETRSGQGASTVDGDYLGAGKVAGGTAIELQVTGRGGVAADAESAMLNVTVTEPERLGFVTVYPCESGSEDPPLSSNLNYAQGQTIPNAVLARLGSTGKACLFTLATSHLVVDVTGYVPAGAAPVGIEPARYLETRSAPGDETFDGQAMPRRRVAAGGVVEFEVAGRGEVPSNAESVILNIAAVDPTAPGFLTVFPCGIADPGTSNLNYGTGETRANLAQTSVGSGGKVCISSKAETHVIADVLGYLPPGGNRVAIEPARCADTRVGPQYRTFDGLFLGDGPIAGGDVYEVTIAGRCNIPTAAIAAYMNVTAVNAEGPGFLTVYPCDEARPTSSNVNYSDANAQPNSVVSKFSLDGEGKICIYASETTDVIVDVSGYVPPGSPAFTKIAHGGVFGCGITEADDLICWGHDQFDSLPFIDESTRSYRPGIGSVADISIFGHRGCVVYNDGTGACWGQGPIGQLGDGEPIDINHTQSEPTPIVGPSGTGTLNDIESIITHDSHSCAVTTDGTAYCWGNDHYGSLGIAGGSGNDDTSVPVEVTVIPAGRTVVDIAPGDSSTCAVLDDGSVLCWGFDADGIYNYLGDGAGKNGGVVVSDDGAFYPLENIVEIDAGFSHYCAADTDGVVWCWGYNQWGKLGDGSTDDFTHAVPVDNVDDAVAVSAGEKNTCALESNGDVTCWGAYRYWGADIADADAPVWWDVPLPEPAIGLDTISSYTGCWLTDDGFARCAGWNFNWESGYPTDSGAGQREPGLVNTWLAG